MDRIPDLPNEIWYPLPFDPTGYEISNLGRVKSLIKIVPGRHYRKEERILKNGVSAQGYLRVVITQNDRKITIVIHRTLWEVAYGDIPENFRVGFLDNNKLNVNLLNLYLYKAKAPAVQKRETKQQKLIRQRRERKRIKN